MTTVRRQLLALALAFFLLSAASADAAKWKLEGRGFGHGVGMSQYGALGLAKKGRGYKSILKRYFTQITVGKTNTRNVNVLIASGLGSVPFTGATRACGKDLNKGKSYSFRAEGSSVSLRRPNGSKLSGCGNEGSARGGASVVFSGVAVYRGDLRARNVGGSLYAINHVRLEDYLKGVIPNESPASWPKAALRAQAVAARSYALATRVGGNGYDLYDDTRSQVYSGKSTEQRSTNRAVKATEARVVQSGGTTVAAYFFSTSGGRTENSEFGFGGGSPRPYLKSVKDPYDKVSPHHRWSFRLSQAQMEAELSGLFAGNLKKVKVLKTGRSPRIVQARVVGSRDSTVVSGDTLRYRFGLRSTWVRFKEN
jgi:stage II sporulation protein D